jgi:hypothetical protein
MIAAEDEASWEGDPGRCEDVFAKARSDAESSGFTVREITLTVPYDEIDKAFSTHVVEAAVSQPEEPTT